MYLYYVVPVNGLSHAVEIGYAPSRSRNCPFFIKSKNGLTSTFKSLEKLRYELRNTWNEPTANQAVDALKKQLTIQ